MTTHHTARDATTPIFDTVVADIGLIWWPPAETHDGVRGVEIHQLAEKRTDIPE
ncbi:hypothetical protein QRX50_36670 [Amycolatopsis carbonis]|uniref:Uncharacterized protein n=1 Tax=Amycolatopsis carbonis TaxID=715471 RepID=A0A9Y2MSQ9_9PSEU|nr:hypothetical protein [Amycolatopsis sp. 2-15]WIX76916.1 hypothetical protein QRX50_36670 [Amycolatopsis sp. 2-15]